MIRYAFVQNQVLKIYSSLPSLSFPFDVKQAVEIIPNCRYMSYQDFAELNRCSINDIVHLCESKSGCTHYDVKNNRYLILCNHSTNDNNNTGRQLWTGGHELGHVVCNHFNYSTYDKMSENSLSNSINPTYESEADFFSATILAPFPLYKVLGIKSVIDIQNVFGLSCEASVYRYKQYLKWQSSHYKTAWENDMVRVFKRKY